MTLVLYRAMMDAGVWLLEMLSPPHGTSHIRSTLKRKIMAMIP